MALDAQKIKGLEDALKDPDISDEVRTYVLKELEDAKNESLSGWAKAGGVEAPPAAPGSLGMRSVIGSDAQPKPAETNTPVYDTQFGPPAQDPGDDLIPLLDQKYDLFPQILSMTPATTDPAGDAAAAEKWRAGPDKGDVTIVYEPPVSLIQKQLIENPAFLRVLRANDPPPLEELTSLTADSPLYQDAANYLWRQTAEAAAKTGKPVYRYSKAPWLWDDKSGVLSTLGLKLGGAVAGPMTSAKNAFVLGADDTALFGAGRAAQETVQPEQRMAPGADVMGLNEGVKQPTAELNQQDIEDHPIAHGAGQVLGALAPWGAVERLYQSTMRGGEYLAAKLGIGQAPAAAKFAGRIGANMAANTGTVAGQEAVDLGAQMVREGEPPTGEQASAAGQRILGTLSPMSALEATAGETAGALAHGGANTIRDSERFNKRLRAVEPNLNLGPSAVLTGPRVAGTMGETIDRAAREGKQPGDYIAQEIAPAIRKEAGKGVQAAKAAEGAEKRNYYQTEEGAARLPPSRLQEASLEKLRDHHQPTAEGGLEPVDNKFGDYQRVFNKTVGDVSMTPVEGATELTPKEAETFLDSRGRYKLLQKDIEAAQSNTGAPREPIDRDAYLRTIKDSRAREAANEEIEASIEDIVGDGGSAAAREKAEQQVLQELVDEASFVDANGTLSEYLGQRGVDKVYVSPRGVDARRAETRLKGLSDPDLIDAAKADRQMRPQDGKRGGWAETRERHASNLAEAQDIEKSVAPGGNAFEPIARTVQSAPGEKQLVDRIESLANQAGPGTAKKYEQLRTLQDTQEIAGRSRFRGRSGESRSLTSTQNWMDAAQLRALPILRALEGPLGPLGGPGAGAAGRAGLIGSREPTYDGGNVSSRERYERARAKRLAEIEAEKKNEADKYERQRTEKIRRRR